LLPLEPKALSARLQVPNLTRFGHRHLMHLAFFLRKASSTLGFHRTLLVMKAPAEHKDDEKNIFRVKSANNRQGNGPKKNREEK
jgi:hypothetical protein